VEVHDDPVEAAHELAERLGPLGAFEGEVVVGGRRPRRAHLHVVALAAQGADLLHRVGADAVAHGRVRRDHEDALTGGGGGHGMASMLASMRSSVAGQV
jgi:hypothetical protein